MEEWQAQLQQHLRDLEKLTREAMPRLDFAYAEFGRRRQAAQAAQAALRIAMKHVDERHRYVGQRHVRITAQVLNLVKQLRYGKALLATNQDLQAFERAIKKRRTRLRVAKLRKHRKAYKGAVAEIPVPGELSAQ